MSGMALSRSFLGPFAEVAIGDRATGKTVRMLAPSHPFITGASVELQGSGDAPSMSIDIDMPYDEGIKILDGTLFGVGNVVAMRFGYTDGDVTPWFNGRMEAGGESLSIGPDGVSGSIELKNMALGAFAHGGSEFTSLNGLSVIEHIAKTLKRELDVGPIANSLLKKDGRPIVYGLRTYIEALDDVTRERGLVYWFGMVADGPKRGRQALFVRHMKNITEQPPLLKFVMRGVPNADENVYPMFSFSPSGHGGLFLIGDEKSQGARSVQGAFVDSRTGKVVRSKSSFERIGTSAQAKYGNTLVDADVEWPEFSDFPVDIKLPAGTTADVMTLKDNGGGQQGADDDADREVAIDNYISGFGAQVSTIGLPLLKPNTMVELHGLGRKFSGAYLVMKVSHKFSGGDFSTELELKGQGLFAAPKEQAVRSTGRMTAPPEPSMVGPSALSKVGL